MKQEFRAKGNVTVAVTFQVTIIKTIREGFTTMSRFKGSSESIVTIDRRRGERRDKPAVAPNSEKPAGEHSSIIKPNINCSKTVVLCITKTALRQSDGSFSLAACPIPRNWLW